VPKFPPSPFAHTAVKPFHGFANIFFLKTLLDVHFIKSILFLVFCTLVPFIIFFFRVSSEEEASFFHPDTSSFFKGGCLGLVAGISVSRHFNRNLRMVF